MSISTSLCIARDERHTLVPFGTHDLVVASSTSFSNTFTVSLIMILGRDDHELTSW